MIIKPQILKPLLLLLVFIGWALWQQGFLSVAEQGNSQQASSQVQVIDGDLIRVGISNNAMESLEHHRVHITANKPFVLRGTTAGGPSLQLFSAGVVLTVYRDKQGIWVSESQKKIILGPFPGSLRLEPESESSNQCETCTPDETTMQFRLPELRRRGQAPSYRGVFELMPATSSQDKLLLVNILPVDEYLKAVVPNELPPRFGYEATKAQAVAARNYAVRPREKPWPQFDICDSQYCQVYFGAGTEVDSTNQALKETQGLFALYQGEPILALYSSSHGGYSESYSNAFSDPKTQQFPAPPIAYLSGHADYPDVEAKTGDLRQEAAARKFWTDLDVRSYDQLSPHYRWKRYWTLSELTAVLNQSLRKISVTGGTRGFVTPTFGPKDTIGKLQSIKIIERGVSGKAMRLEIIGSKGHWRLDKELVIRKAFLKAGKMLPSANMVINRVDNTVIVRSKHRKNKAKHLKKWVGIEIVGGGFGHGVGMSQLGASWMSDHHQDYKAILSHYYRGIQLGSRPVVADNGQAKRTHFYSPGKEGTLRVEAGPGEAAVNVVLNGAPMWFSDTNTPRKKVKAAVVLPLWEKRKNVLTVYPDTDDPKRPVKAWIEIGNTLK
ncbi:MAG: SpoIID/LytB domain-containing protein [Cyanobacteria bacterium]|nr:SpoIID/LytB domain-containing protein [Cyanobacteriota bacterium]